MFRRFSCRYAAASVFAAAKTETPIEKRRLLEFTKTYGFSLKTTRRFDELNLVAYEWEHDKTGAVYYHIDTDDRNNTFCIGFRTPAADNKGTSHVLEHTVLCGSKKYPVRDPFFLMLRRSLSTFMNAMTGADYTLYPFATTNPTDFGNLLDVYLDAVFHPLLRAEDFRQEGHRVEVEDTDGAKPRLVFNGVVYNEMRGVVSDPAQHFAHALLQTTLPGTHYTHISGGHPPDILSLTYDELLAFHRRHYHPSNSITFSYGNQHPERCMAALGPLFDAFSRGAAVAVPMLRQEDRLSAARAVTLDGPINPMGDAQQQRRVAWAVAVQSEDNGLHDLVDLSVLDTLLSSGPSAPMYKALIESEMGTRFTPMSGYASYLSSPIVSFGVEGVDARRPDAAAALQRAVCDTLECVARDGFDARRVRAVVFQAELQQRHRAADYGVELCTGLCATALCRAGCDALDFVDWLPRLRWLEAQQAAPLLPRITRNLLSNPHRVLLTVEARREHLDTLRGALQQMETDLNARATDAEVAAAAQETAQRAARLNTAVSADVLPTLRVADIPRVGFVEPVARPHAGDAGVHTLGCATNGLVYVHGFAPFGAALRASIASGAVDVDVPLWHALLARLGAGEMSYKELAIATELCCGGFQFEAQLNPSRRGGCGLLGGTAFGFYTTRERLRGALDLLRRVLLEPRASKGADEEVRSRAAALTKARCASAIGRLQREGHRVAARSASAKLTRRAAAREAWGGIAQSKRAAALLAQLQSPDTDASQQALEHILHAHTAFGASLAAHLRSGVMWATCDPNDETEVARALAEFRRDFPPAFPNATDPVDPSPAKKPSQDGADTFSGDALRFDVPLPPTRHAQRLREALPIDTSFAAVAIANPLDWLHPHQPALRVGCQLLANEFLHRRVREEGGAYGAHADATLMGEAGGVVLTSYRDPTPEQTVAVFGEAAAWLRDASHVTQQSMDEAKLRLFAGIDAPYAPDSYGEACFLHDLTREERQRMREALLAVTTRDVMDAATYLDMRGGGEAVVCVLCPEETAAEGEKEKEKEEQ